MVKAKEDLIIKKASKVPAKDKMVDSDVSDVEAWSYSYHLWYTKRRRKGRWKELLWAEQRR